MFNTQQETELSELSELDDEEESELSELDDEEESEISELDDEDDEEENNFINNLIINFSEDETDSDLDDEEEDELHFPHFTNIFNLFRNDNHVKYLTFEEKQLVTNLLIQGNFMDDVYFNMVKEQILTNRAFNHPSIDILNIRNVISVNDVIDSRTIRNNMYSRINCYDKVTAEEQNELEILFNSQRNIYDILKDEPQESLLLQLPEELIEKILIMSTPDIDLNMINFSNMRLTCKKIYRIMFSKRFSRLVLKKYSMLKLFNSKFQHVDKIPVRIFNNISYELIFGVFKNYLGSVIGVRLIKALGGFNAYFRLPFIDHCVNSKCLDNLCGNRCVYNYHYLCDFAKSPVSRGIDSMGRLFILFFYRSENGLFFEFVYNNENPSELNLTFSGIGMNTFIGNSTVNYTNTISAMYREIKAPSYDYIERLMKGQLCGEVYYKDGNLEFSYEDKEKAVSLYFNRKVIKKYVKKNFDFFARPELYINDEE
jgi:hypothetical protein